MNVFKNLSTILLFVVVLLATMPVLAQKDTPKAFNDYVLEVVDSYPQDGSHSYAWVNEEGYFGITRDLYYNDQIFVTGDAKKRSYCSGITFEVFFQAYQQYNQDHGFTGIGKISNLEEMETFRRQWYGADGNRQTIKHALEVSGLGYEVNDYSEVEPGDFVQLWRHSGSGHTVVFIKWAKDTDDKIIGFMYWSSNYGRGLSKKTEYFGDSGKSIKKDETYFMKVIDPAEWRETNL